MAYDVFISYRRRGAGAGVAGELQTKLENLGYNVFLDVDDIGSGQFPQQIERAIEECSDFIIVLSPGTLDRCADKDDWVRREIVEAQSMDKNIIGVGLPGFVMPDANTLPEVLRSLPTRQVFQWAHEYRSASFSRIVENLVSTQRKKQRQHNRRIIAASALLVVVVAFVVGLLVTKCSESANDSFSHKGESAVKMAEVQFYNHVTKAMELVEVLPNAKEFESHLDNYIDSTVYFRNLVSAIQEYDTAISLKNEHKGAVKDPFDVETQQRALEQLKSDYLHSILNDLRFYTDINTENSIDYALHDIEMARILASDNNQNVLDSLYVLEKELEKRLKYE